MTLMPDPELDSVAEFILQADPDGSRIAKVLRETFDQLYDGQRTGRYRWDDLFKTERTHCGTLVEINLCREFRFQNGLIMDYRIANVEVDCKFSRTYGKWMIPREAMNRVCLLGWASDEEALWSVGIVRITEDILTKSKNQDLKGNISAQGKKSIRVLFDRKPLPPNVLLQLPRQRVKEILDLSSGQERVNQIIRIALGLRLSRVVIATVAKQDDFMKRLRGNGGARSALKPEGIIILGHYAFHRKIAEKLGVPIPGIGDTVCVRVCPASHPGLGVAEIEGGLWRIATDSDPVVEAPNVRHK